MHCIRPVGSPGRDAFALLAVAAFGAASPLGLGAMWARILLVERHRALL